MFIKPQVKALLEVISKDETRPVLTHALLDEYSDRLVLVATDAYKMAIIALDNITKEQREQYKGKLISRGALEKWYKLAATRDTLTTEAMLSMTETAEDVKFPQWQQLVSDKAQPTETILFQSQYALTLEKLAGTFLTYELHGKIGAMQARSNGNIYLLMPMKQ